MTQTVKNPPGGDLGSITGLGRSPGAGHSNPLQYSCLENPMDRGAWLPTVHEVAQSDRTEQAQHMGLKPPVPFGKLPEST